MKSITLREITDRGNQLLIGLETCKYTANFNGVWLNADSKPNAFHRFMLKLVFGIEWYRKEQSE